MNGHPGVLHRSVTPASGEGAPVLAWRETPDEWIALVGDIGSTVADPDLLSIAAQFHLVPIDEWRRAIGTAPPATPASATATPASAPTTSKP